MAESKRLMTEGSIAKKMVLFALPIMFGDLFQQLYNTADSLIVGNYLGSNSLAAVSSSGNLIDLMVGFLSGLATGAGVVIARYYGAREMKKMETSIHTTIAMGLAAGVALMISGLFLAPHILRWMGTPAAVMPESTAYFRVYFLGSVGFVMYNVSVGILRAVGDSRHPLYYLIISSILNVILDVLFVAVFHFGVEGAALATAISQYVSAIFAVGHLIRSKEDYHLNVKKIRFDWEMLKRIVRFGLPSAVQNSIISFANAVVQTNINSFGEYAMAGCGAFNKIEGFGFLPVGSFNMAVTTFVGQNLGARQYERAKKGARFGVTCAVVLAELIGVIMFLGAPYMIGAFDSNPEVIAIGAAKAQISSLFFFVLAYSHASAAVLRGAGKAAVPMVVMMVCWCLVRVTVLSIMVPLTHNILVVHWVYPLTWTLSAICFFIYIRKSDWLHALDND